MRLLVRGLAAAPASDQNTLNLGTLMKTSSITRKAFCARLATGSVLLLIQACGGGGSDDAVNPLPAPGPKPAGGCTDIIATNHGHVLMIATADLDSLTDKVYNIQGGAVHNHTVTLTVADLRALKAGTVVTSNSSTAAGHEHSVSITCT